MWLNSRPVCLHFHPWSSACAFVLECSLTPSLYFFLKSFFHLFLNPAMVPDENSMEDPCATPASGAWSAWTTSHLTQFHYLIFSFILYLSLFFLYFFHFLEGRSEPLHSASKGLDSRHDFRSFTGCEPNDCDLKETYVESYTDPDAFPSSPILPAVLQAKVLRGRRVR